MKNQSIKKQLLCNHLYLTHPKTGNESSICYSDAIQICEVSTRTVQRWSKNGQIPKLARKLLEHYVFGIIPNNQWQDNYYYINRQGELYCLDHVY